MLLCGGLAQAQGVPPAPAASGPAPRWSVVEFRAPQVPGFAPGRVHHALSVRSEWTARQLRGIGLEVSDCTAQFRMPTRFRQQSANAEAGFEMQAQVRLSCRLW